MRCEATRSVVGEGGLGRRRRRARVLDIASRGGAVDVHARLPGAARHAAFEDSTLRVEAGHSLDGVADLAEVRALTPVDVEHPHKNVIYLWGNGKNGGKETLRVSKVGLESWVAGSGRLPGVATSRKVEEDDT